MLRLSKFLTSLMNVVMAFALVSMMILVFGNVILRYVFNSGIAASEELSRYLFVWLTFIGAIGALQANQHLGLDSLVKRLPDAFKKIFLTVSYLLMIVLCSFIFHGAWKLTTINVNSKAPATGLPLSFIYVTGILMSASMIIILIINIVRLFTNRSYVNDLLGNKESEESNSPEKPHTKEGKQI